MLDKERNKNVTFKNEIAFANTLPKEKLCFDLVDSTKYDYFAMVLWRIRLMARTPPSHGGYSGSNPGFATMRFALASFFI